MGESARVLPRRGVSFGLGWRSTLFTAAFAAYLVFAAAASGQAPPSGSGPAGEVQRIAIVLARELRMCPPPSPFLMLRHRTTALRGRGLP